MPEPTYLTRDQLAEHVGRAVEITLDGHAATWKARLLALCAPNQSVLGWLIAPGADYPVTTVLSRVTAIREVEPDE